MDEQDKDEWHVRLLHTVEALPSRLSSLGAGISTIGVLLVVFMAQSGRCNCDIPKTDENQCEADCAVRSGKPAHAKETPRYNGSECWCFDPTTGQSTRLW